MNTTNGGNFGDVPVAVPASREAAKELIVRATHEYSHWMQTLDGSDFADPVQLPFGATPRGQCVAMPVLDLVHHHGQIAYIQTVLGDTENHFHAMNMDSL